MSDIIVVPAILKIDEEAILKRLAQVPVHFVLNAQQVERLKKAGATEKLLAALQQKRAAEEPVVEVTDIARVEHERSKAARLESLEQFFAARRQGLDDRQRRTDHESAGRRDHRPHR